jgi:UrcA family protein
MFRTYSSHTLIATLLLTGACAAHAASPADGSATAAPSVRVSYRDLDLTSRAGTRALYERISRAAHTVCDAHGARDVNTLAHSASCARESIARALAQVQANELAALTFPGSRRG